MEYRQPTVDHAVEWLVKMSHNRQYCRECVQYWREKFGDEFASEVRLKALAKLKINPNGKST